MKATGKPFLQARLRELATAMRDANPHWDHKVHSRPFDVQDGAIISIHWALRLPKEITWDDDSQ